MPDINPAAEIAGLQRLMNEHVGPLRSADGLRKAILHVEELKGTCASLPAPRGAMDAEWLDLHDLANMRLVAECVARAALVREESRGAHQREDCPETSEAWQRHLPIRLSRANLHIES
jgi:succinate dehydrogenase/fumarate reductase flavoprotein subunit